MSRRTITFIIIVVVVAAILWVDLPGNGGINIGTFQRDLETKLGLDLEGGLQVLLEVDSTKMASNLTVSSDDLNVARQILENRSNGLGVSEVVFQVAGSNRIVGEFPGLTNVKQVIDVLKETGLLEFVDLGKTPLDAGTVITTDFGTSAQTPTTDSSGTPSPSTTNNPISTVPVVETPTQPAPTETSAPTDAVSPISTPAGENATPPAETTTPTEAAPVKIYHTLMTGADLNTVGVSTDQVGKYVIDFELKAPAVTVFGDYTAKNIGSYLAIVVDKKIISAPVIKGAIPEGKGQISGSFTYDSANALAINLRYGSLPIPLKVAEYRVIGPSLGQDSLNKSLIAGLVGFILVALFMIIYYRLPGSVAVIAIAIFFGITLALYKLIPVTLTLPGIAGLLLSTGGALDANILIFERFKEELRAGRNLRQATDLAWKRAWSSIRDSNVATLITSGILFWFGSAYGASIVKGFALTLALGVAVSLLCAIFVTRTLLGLIIDLVKPSTTSKLLGA